MYDLGNTTYNSLVIYLIIPSWDFLEGRYIAFFSIYLVPRVMIVVRPAIEAYQRKGDPCVSKDMI